MQCAHIFHLNRWYLRKSVFLQYRLHFLCCGPEILYCYNQWILNIDLTFSLCVSLNATHSCLFQQTGNINRYVSSCYQHKFFHVIWNIVSVVSEQFFKDLLSLLVIRIVYFYLFVEHAWLAQVIELLRGWCCSNEINLFLSHFVYEVAESKRG